MKMRLTLIPAMLILGAACCESGYAQPSVATGNTGGTGSATSSDITSQLLSGMTTAPSGLSSGMTGSTGTSGTSGSAAGAAGSTQPPGFVGASAAENFIGGAREATNQQGTNRQFQQFIQDTINASSQSQQSSTPREIRTTLRIGFGFPTASAAQQSGKLANANALTLTRFTATRPEFSGISVSLANDGTAVLTGLSPSSETSRLAANLIRLQPGVRKVKNEVAVVQQ